MTSHLDIFLADIIPCPFILLHLLPITINAIGQKDGVESC